MHRTRVKICGITSPEDALAAVEAGADAIGLVFAESPRRVDPAWARRIVADVPPYVSRVGVFVDEAPGVVADVVRRVGLDTVQLHGGETPAECADYDSRVVKALRVAEGFRGTDVEPYRGECDAVLLATGGFRPAGPASGSTGHCAVRCPTASRSCSPGVSTRPMWERPCVSSGPTRSMSHREWSDSPARRT